MHCAQPSHLNPSNASHRNPSNASSESERLYPFHCTRTLESRPPATTYSHTYTHILENTHIHTHRLKSRDKYESSFQKYVVHFLTIRHCTPQRSSYKKGLPPPTPFHTGQPPPRPSLVTLSAQHQEGEKVHGAKATDLHVIDVGVAPPLRLDEPGEGVLEESHDAGDGEDDAAEQAKVPEPEGT